jgi:tetratricopeptide (TPR) repeat protein
LGRYDEALDFINKGLELFPDSSLNCNKSYFLYHLERYDEALDSINKCLDCSSDEDDIELKEKIESKLNNS